MADDLALWSVRQWLLVTDVWLMDPHATWRKDWSNPMTCCVTWGLASRKTTELCCIILNLDFAICLPVCHIAVIV